MQVGRKVGLVLASNIAGAILGYGALLVIGRAFDPAALGSFIFATSIAGFFALATTLGLGAAHQRLVAQGVAHATVMGTVARLRLSLLGAGIVILAGAAWILKVAHGPTLTDATTPLVLVGALAIQIVAMARVFLAETWLGLQQVGRPEATRLLDAGFFLVFLANAGLLIRHLSGQWSPAPEVGAWWASVFDLVGALDSAQTALLLVACALVAKLLSLVAAVWLAFRDGLTLGPYDAGIARHLWLFALPLALNGVIWLVLQNTDVVLLGYFWTAHEVGLYGTAQKLAVLAALVATAASGVLFSRFSQLAAQNDAAQADATLAGAERWILLLVAPAAAGLVALARPGIHIAVGDAYLEAAPSLGLLALATVVYTLQVPLVARFMGHGMTRLLVTVGLVNAGANLVLNLAFIPRFVFGWGPAGAAGATAISNAIAYVILRRAARHHFGTAWLGRETPRIAIAALATGLFWWQAATRWPHTMDRVWELGAWMVLGGFVNVIALALLGALRREDLQWIRRAAHPRSLWQEIRGR